MRPVYPDLACQAGNPVSLPEVPTITTGRPGGILAGMAPGSDAMPGDGPPPGALPDAPPAESLGVAEVVMTILEARKTMPRATAASVSREQRRDLLHVRVTLLESPPVSPAGQPGAGEVVAEFTVRRLDDDLAAAFGQKDVIILK
jgi:hypothetical protein